MSNLTFKTASQKGLTIVDPETTIPQLVQLVRDMLDGFEEGMRNCESDANDGVDGAETPAVFYLTDYTTYYEVFSPEATIQSGYWEWVRSAVEQEKYDK